MPPPTVTPQGSRTGLIAWLVVFVVLFITATSFAIYGYSQWSKTEQALNNERSQAQAIAVSGDPYAQQLISAKDDTKHPEYAQAANAMEVAKIRIDKLAKLAGGQSTAPDAAADQARAVLA